MNLPGSNSRLVSRASVATLLTFFVSGFSLASFLSRIPTLRDALELSPAPMGSLLLVGAVGSVLSMPSSGPLVGRFGPRNTVWASFAVWASGLTGVIVAFEARNIAAVAVCLFFTQAGTSLANSTMNVEGGYVELLAKRSIMPWYHAAFSVGTVVAAALGATVLYFHIGFAWHMGFVIVVTIGIMVWAGLNYLPQDVVADMTMDESGATARTARAWKEKRTLLIGVLVFGTGLLEGAANDWLALAMVDGFQVTPAHGTATLALYLTVLTATRLVSPALLRRWSADRLVRVLLIGAAIGVLMLAISPWLGLALFGVVAWGIGASLGFPSAASALSRQPAMAAARLSVLSTLGYGAFLAGPPTIGYIAEFIGYRYALGFVVIPVLLSIALTPYLRAEPTDSHPVLD
ncbi:MAG: MFS transporter [Actinomycetaceae bacterium]|nr:MFS transporter [Actinomycetaceae bacterium]